MEPYANGNSNGNPDYGYRNAPPTNGKSIAAMVLGILSIMFPYIGFILGIIGIVFARISSSEINMRGENGKGFALAGLVTGIIGTVLWGLVDILIIVFIVVAINSDPTMLE